MDDCIFCKIIKQDIPSSKVYEDDKVYAFLDIAPVNKGHTLVIPKAHAETIHDISDEDMVAVSRVVKKLSTAVKEATGCDGISIAQSNGKAANQVVPHLHFHIIPRLDDDGLRTWPQSPYPDGEAEEFRQKIEDKL